MNVLGEIVHDGTVATLGAGMAAVGGIMGAAEINFVLSGQATDILPLLASAVCVGTGLYGLVGGGIRLVGDLGDIRNSLL